MQDAYVFEGHHNNPFTFFLLEGLAGANGESTDFDGNVTPELLHRYIFNKIMELHSDTRSKHKPFLKCESAGKIVLAHHPHLIISHDTSMEDLKKENTILLERLKINEKRQQEFINIVAHELRNSIQPILGLAETLMSKIRDSPQQELLELIIRNVKRLNQIVESNLTDVKIEELMKISKERFNLKDLVSEVIADYGFQLKESNIKVNLSYEFNIDVDVIVEADRNKLAQILRNILNNALKFTKEGIILVKLENAEGIKRGDEKVCISIRDSGRGIKPEILHRLFTTPLSSVFSFH